MGRYMTNEDMAIFSSGKSDAETAGVSAFSIASTSSNSIGAIINNFITKNNLETMKSNVKTYWGSQLVTAKNLNKVDITLVPIEIKSRLDADWAKILDMLKIGVDGGVGAMFSGMYELGCGTANLIQSYNGIIQRAGIDPWISRYVKQQCLNNVPNFELSWYMKHLGILGDSQYKILHEWEGWKSGWIPNLEQTLIKPLPIEMFIELLQRGTMKEKDIIAEMKRYRFTEAQIKLALTLAKRAPEPYRAAEAAARGLFSVQDTKTAFSWYGLDPAQAEVWIEAQRTRPALGSLADMRWRGIVDDAYVKSQIRLTGYPLEYGDQFLATLDQIPPAQDIITMVVREAFEDANIVKAPTEFADWISKKGFKSYWADKYWTAHYTPIPISQAYDNLRRGYHDEAWMKDVLRIADIHPRWHDDIIKVAWQPPAIRELGYGFDVGVYTEADIVEYRRWGGLSLVDAKKAARSLVDYRLDAERNAMRTANMNLYINNSIDEATFRAELKKYRTNDLAADLWVERGNINKKLKEVQTPLTESKSATRSDAQWMYEKGLRTVEWFTARLSQMGYSAESVQLYLDQSNRNIYDKQHPEVATTVKTLSLAQINDLYIAKLMDRITAVTRITSLGYTPADTELMINIWDKGTPSTEKELTLSQLTELYKDQTISKDIFKARVLKMGYSADDTISIITLADKITTTTKAQPKLTESEIEQLYLYGYYDAQGLIQEYINRGFAQKDAVLKTYISTLGIELPMMKAHYKNAWINETDLANGIRTMITPFNQLGNVDAIINNIMMAIVKNTQGERIATERDLTKAEIVKGAKNQVFTIPQAIELLVGMGYSEAEAQYILALNQIIAINDPKGYWDMRQTVELQRKAMKLSHSDIPNELIPLEADLKKAKARISEIKNDPQKIIELGKELGHAAVIEGQINTIKSKLNIKGW